MSNKTEENKDKLLLVLSKDAFEHIMSEYELNDDNVENKKHLAIISILDPDSSQRDYNTHYFKKDHINVLNMDFFDIEREYERDGYQYKPISEEQGKVIAEFMKKNDGKNFIIHCHSGISRSAACATILVNYYGYPNKQFKDYVMPNRIVYKAIKKYIKKK